MHCTSDDRGSRADQRRRHLIATARALFGEHGFHRTGVAQIATASGIRVGQIYRDFASKEDIIAAMAEEDIAAFLDEDALHRAMAAGDAVAIRSWIARFATIDDPLEECRMFAEILAEAGRNPRIAEIHRNIDVRIRACLNAALAALAPSPERAADRAALVDLILALGLGVMTRRIIDSGLDLVRLNRDVIAVVDRGIESLQANDAAKSL